MADKTTEELQKEIDALKADKVALAAENTELQETIEAASSDGKVAAKIPGKATVTLETPEGKKVKKTVGFAPGRRNVRLPNGAAVSSASFLNVVNGKKLTDEEKQDEQLVNLTKEAATAHLTYMVSVNTSVLEDRK
jgi:hypothetical protein